ncbi:MAG TPA: hypothetical protein VGK10_20115 [Prolixibacteraceae bacterium]|jgi:hypothetical protein
MMLVPGPYNFTLKQSKVSPYGCWTILDIQSEKKEPTGNQIAGELIYMDADTLYLLTGDRNVQAINSKRIKKAELYIYKNQAGTYFAFTSITLLPNIIGSFIVAGEFAGDILALGIPMAVVGIAHIIIEGSSDRNIMVYPERNKLESFKPFARFPGDMPMNVDLKELTLKKPVMN